MKVDGIIGNDSLTVSKKNSVKLNYPCRCGLPLARREDPLKLYCR